MYKVFKENLPDSVMRMALAFASSKAVTQRCRSISFEAFKWNVWVPPLEITKLLESTVCITALTKLIVPLQVWATSVGFLNKMNNEV